MQYIIVLVQCLRETSRMADASDCGELQNEPWELSDTDELFAQVLLPDDIIDGREQDDALVATDSVGESAKVCYPAPRLESSAAAGCPESRFGPPVTDSEIIAAQKASVPANTKKSTNWAVNVWKDWAEYRKQTCSAPDECPPHILICQVSELQK